MSTPKPAPSATARKNSHASQLRAPRIPKHNSDVVNLPTSTNDVSPHPSFTHVATLKDALTALVDSLTDLESTPGSSDQDLEFWDLIELAKQFEETLKLRGLIDLHVVNKLLTPAGIDTAGTKNTVSFLMDHLGISHREASERVNAAKLDGDIEPDNTKESLPPDAAEGLTESQPTEEELAAEKKHREQQQRLREQNANDARAATASGRLTAQTRADILWELSRLLPGGAMTAEEIKAQVYSEVDQLTAREIKALARELVTNSNEAASTKTDPFTDLRRRRLSVSKPDSDGCVKVNGVLDGASSTLLLQLLSSYAKRGVGTPVPAHEDKRTFPQLNADALRRILEDATRQAHKRSGTPAGLASLVVVANANDFAHRTSTPWANPWAHDRFHTNVGTTLNACQLLRLGLSDNALLSLIDTRDGFAPVNLTMHQGQRHANYAQRVALQIIDGGCQCPGCDKPIAQCDIHHILPFIEGGRTDIENLVPLCRTHHSQNDDTWQAPNRSHMSPRTAETNYRSGRVYVDEEGTAHPPTFNTGPATRRAPGYVPPPQPPGTAEPPAPPGSPEHP